VRELFQFGLEALLELLELLGQLFLVLLRKGVNLRFICLELDVDYIQYLAL
jgi:hypothetical protein